jgi:predicted permease
VTLLDIVSNTLLPIFLIVGLGILVERRLTVDPRTLSRAVIYLFSPCLILGSIARSDLQADEIGLILAMAALSTVAMAGVGWVLARLGRFDRKLTSAFMLSVVLINAGNYGLPLNEFAFGAGGLQRAVVFFVVTAFTANTLGVYLASRGEASVRRSLLNVFTVPLPYATALGLVLNMGGLTLPLPLDRAVTVLGQAAVPCMLLILGLQLSRSSVKGRTGPLLLAAAARLLVAPLVAVAVAALLGLTGLTRQVSIVEASMPSAVLAGVLATEFGSDAEFATAAILVSTLASVVSLSVLLFLLK